MSPHPPTSPALAPTGPTGRAQHARHLCSEPVAPTSPFATVGDDDDAVTTAGLLFETSFLVRRSLEHRLSAELGLRSHAFEVLLRLFRSPDHRLRMADLAAQATLTPSGLTRAVDRLVATGLVEREACPEDRRGAFAVLTPTGTQRMATALPLHRQHIEELFDQELDPAEVAALAGVLRKLRDSMAAKRPGSCTPADRDGPAPDLFMQDDTCCPGDGTGPRVPGGLPGAAQP